VGAEEEAEGVEAAASEAASEAAAAAKEEAVAAPPMMAPDERVRHGAFGRRAAEALRDLASAASVRAAQAALGGLREVLLDELDRSAAYDAHG